MIPKCFYCFLFQSLKAFSDGLKQQADFSCKEGEKDVNRKKNRYKDILPCESYFSWRHFQCRNGPR